MENQKHKVIFIPGGPGISSDYLLPFVSDMNALDTDFDFQILKIEDFFELNILSYDELLYSISKNTLFDKKHLKLTVIAHSFGCKILSDLIRKKLVNPFHSILINWPSFGVSNEFQESINSLKLNTNYSDESDFVNNWKRMLPLYFYKKRPAEWQLDLLIYKTYWLKSKHLLENNINEREIFKGLYIDLIISNNDILLKQNELEWSINTFGLNNTHTIKDSGHFPMLEKPSELAKLILHCINY